MSEEKLDLILNVVTDIKNRQESLEKIVGENIDRLEKRFYSPELMPWKIVWKFGDSNHA